MDYQAARNVALKVFVGFLALSALIAIIAVLGAEFGEVQAKILGTTFSISAAGFCVMSCVAFIEKRGQPGLGLFGIVCSLAAAAMVISAIWFEIGGETFWKTAVTLIIAAMAVALALLLSLAELDPKHRWAQAVAYITIAVLAVQIIAAILGEIEEEGYYRLLIAVSVLTVLFTLLIPVLMKMRTAAGGLAPTLHLSRRDDGSYIDRAGRRYRVSAVDDESPD